MESTNTPPKGQIHGIAPCGLVVYNIPLRYKKKEIQEILFAPNERELIDSMKLYKIRYGKSPEKTLKVEIMFQDSDIREDMFIRLDELEFDDDHILKVKRFNSEKRHAGSKEVSDDIGAKQDKKKRGVIGANVTLKLEKDKDNSMSKEDAVVIAKRENKPKVVQSRKKTAPLEKADDTLFVRNLDYNMTDTKVLAEFFKVNPENVTIPLRKCLDLYTDQFFKLEHMNRGFAIIKFDDYLNIEGKVTEYKNCMFQGRKLIVQVAYKKEAKTQSSI
ncbi:hypothetical protein MOSE0_K07624 [Monosporozyma servazzii]